MHSDNSSATEAMKKSNWEQKKSLKINTRHSFVFFRKEKKWCENGVKMAQYGAKMAM